VPVAVPAPAVVTPGFSRISSTPEVSPKPKPADVEDIPLAFRFAMQQVTVAVHHASETPARFSASLVGGR